MTLNPLTGSEFSLAVLLDDIREHVCPAFGRGKVADYIPELSHVDPRKFAMTVVTVNGEEVSTGDSDEPFSLQSITKLLALILALNRGGDEIWSRVGREPSGTPFNHLAILEAENGAPRNPFVNAGALAVTDYLMASTPDIARLMAGFVRVSGAIEGGAINEAVAASERATAYKNRAIANLLRIHGTITHEPDRVVDAYCRQCALEFSTRQLARAMLPLAARGFSPLAGETMIAPRLVRRVNAVMMTCGMYEATGNFAYRVGLPAKSGVGGGIVAVAPGLGVAVVWSPELDRAGNSLVGTIALELFAQHSGWAIL
ncbi:MAG TPA: glutaminase [Rhabdaerophilum sp.]|nr:glutaminase [Rhabdaerophilum sp.]